MTRRSRRPRRRCSASGSRSCRDLCSMRTRRCRDATAWSWGAGGSPGDAPTTEFVFSPACPHYNCRQVLARLGLSDKLIVIKKPFEPIEILQSASALSRKWQNERALKAHVEGLERVVPDRTRGLEAANRQLRHLASHDALTGLPNRLLLDDRITQAIAQADRQKHEFVVAVLDLDRFKLINDSLGHRACDELLCEVAVRLK